MSETQTGPLDPATAPIPLRPEPAWAALLRRPAAERRATHIHLVGIGGAGLSAIATLLLEQGYTVSGSDQRPNTVTDALAASGATVYRGHRGAHVAGADLVLISSAVPPENAEVGAALAAGIPVVKRAEFLGQLMTCQHGIGVAGSHGKTTTTSMIAIILWRAGLDPSIVVGGRLAVGPGEGMPTTTLAARAGQGPFVIEADEYDRMFLGLQLEIAVVTNVDWDHVDCYPTPATFTAAFRQFVGQLPAHGLLIACIDDPGAAGLVDAVAPGVTVQTYGLSTQADWQARAIRPNTHGGLDAEVWFRGEQVATLSLRTAGRHNVRNALAALAAAHWHGIKPQRAAAMLHDFLGAGRRFELVGEEAGVTVIDDYAHHPTEIAATLSAARLRYGTRRIWTVFQPHTFSRTQALLHDFAHCFDDTDTVLLLDIYAAREKNDLGIHSQIVQATIEHADIRYCGPLDVATAVLLAEVAPGDIVITMSAGDGNQVGQMLLAGLCQRAAPAGVAH